MMDIVNARYLIFGDHSTGFYLHGCHSALVSSKDIQKKHVTHYSWQSNMKLEYDSVIMIIKN